MLTCPLSNSNLQTLRCASPFHDNSTRSLPNSTPTQIDFLFATLDKPVIPEDLDLLDEANLKNLDEKSVLSLNGNIEEVLISNYPQLTWCLYNTRLPSDGPNSAFGPQH